MKMTANRSETDCRWVMAVEGLPARFRAFGGEFIDHAQDDKQAGIEKRMHDGGGFGRAFMQAADFSHVRGEGGIEGFEAEEDFDAACLLHVHEKLGIRMGGGDHAADPMHGDVAIMNAGAEFLDIGGAHGFIHEIDHRDAAGLQFLHGIEGSGDLGGFFIAAIAGVFGDLHAEGAFFVKAFVADHAPWNKPDVRAAVSIARK